MNYVDVSWSKKSGLIISAARKNAGLFQADLAKLVGVCEQTIYKYEQGITEPSCSKLMKICLILNISVPSIFA